MADVNYDAPFRFSREKDEDVLPMHSIHTSLKKFEMFLKVFIENPAKRKLPAKIVAGKVIDNRLLEQWVSFQAPPLLIARICPAQPLNGSQAHRCREMIKACVEASTVEFQQKPYGELLIYFKKAAEIVHQVAYDVSYRLPFILQYFTHLKAIKDGVSVSVGVISKVSKRVRLNMLTSTSTTVMRVNFFKEVLVVNNRESPSNEVFTTREMDYY